MNLFGYSRRDTIPIGRRRRNQSHDTTGRPDRTPPAKEQTREEKLQRRRQERSLWYAYSLKPYITVVTPDLFVQESQSETTTATDDDLICQPVGTPACEEDDAPKKLKLWNFYEGTPHEMDAECGICLLPYEEGDRILQSAADEEAEVCSHVYHVDCMMQWLARGRKQCPLCRSWFVPGGAIKKQMKKAHVATRPSMCHLYDERTMKELVTFYDETDDSEVEAPDLTRRASEISV